jgi:hypothetical protein
MAFRLFGITKGGLAKPPPVATVQKHTPTNISTSVQILSIRVCLSVYVCACVLLYNINIREQGYLDLQNAPSFWNFKRQSLGGVRGRCGHGKQQGKCRECREEWADVTRWGSRPTRRWRRGRREEGGDRGSGWAWGAHPADSTCVCVCVYVYVSVCACVYVHTCYVLIKPPMPYISSSRCK